MAVKSVTRHFDLTDKNGDSSVVQCLGHARNNKENAGGFSVVVRGPNDKMGKVRDLQIFQKSRSHCKILGAVW